jgi:hypothetical protein
MAVRLLRSMTVYPSLTTPALPLRYAPDEEGWMGRLDSNQRPVIILAFGT